MAWYDVGLTGPFDAAQPPAQVREVIDAINVYVDETAVVWPSPFTTTVTAAQIEAADIDVEALGILYNAAQTAIRNLINNVNFYNSSKVLYTVTSLCQEAFGENDFTLATTGHFADDKLFWNELHEALNLMIRFKFTAPLPDDNGSFRRGEDTGQVASGTVFADEFESNPNYGGTGPVSEFLFSWPLLGGNSFFLIFKAMLEWDFSAEVYEEDIVEVSLQLAETEQVTPSFETYPSPSLYTIAVQTVTSIEADAQDRYEQTGTSVWTGDSDDLDLVDELITVSTDVNGKIILQAVLQEKDIFDHSYTFDIFEGNAHQIFVAMSITDVWVEHDFVADL